jgi:hypothetical protein
MLGESIGGATVEWLMQFFRFDASLGSSYKVNNSRDVIMTKAVRTTGESKVGAMYLGGNSLIGLHQADKRVVLLVVQGAVWIAGTNHARTTLLPGRGALIEQGEHYEAGSDTAAVVMVVEGAVEMPEGTVHWE